ncbi:hypothetical protein JANAI62_17680 [Jannaschia pagri]|uniref:Tellurite resistance protein TerB n=1 Tax=Jannaschia pagri TaxID=2829797 RepID=A0ABQ4NLP0_9RHOB|nr:MULTISPECIES: hypothetical protein [unclassified Jannaschia]GIT91312.1 hypothetical protein JANAI61_17700 [Jannaschia sp. AI_61]GIT95145.1 hypothetical protein JANAI62_17680 [Jannaschia sp. AI_62]
MKSPVSVYLSLAVSAVVIWALAPASGQAQTAPAQNRSFVPTALADWWETVSLLPWVIGLMGLAAVFAFCVHKLRLRRRALRREILGLPDGVRFRVADAIVHCVWRSRKIDGERLKRAVEVARNTTNMDYSADHLREAAVRADRVIIPTNFLYMAADLTQKEKLVVFNAAVSVLLADGPLTMHDRNMLKFLAAGLRLRRHELRDLRHLIPT